MPLYSFERVAQFLSRPQFAGDFPPEILKNRLAIMGVKEVLDSSAIQRLGFPFKYYHPLDEAILMLHYFLTKSNQLPDSYIQINTTHVPTKEEENTLSFWKSPKAGLYLDLHSLIENNNARRNKAGLIKRLFVFRDNAHLAYLESTGIGVILEQQSIGIDTGFILTSHQEAGVANMIKAGKVLIQLIHPEEALCEWALGIDEMDAGNQPYGNHLVCKWYRGGKVTDPQSQGQTAAHIDVREYLRLFDFDPAFLARKWNNNATYRFPKEPTQFADLLKANFDAQFHGISAPTAHRDDYYSQFEVKTVPSTLRQFHEALNRIKASKSVNAIDSSSVKSTLRIHDADPNYRHWIRATINLAINRPDVSLERIYILDLDPRKADYKVFEQEVMLYRDFLTCKVSKLDAIWDPKEMGGGEEAPPPEPPENSGNIKLYVITKKAIQAFSESLPEGEKRRILSLLLKGNFIEEGRGETEQEEITDLISVYLAQLDFLFSEQAVFNYKDYKGEPGQAIYDADLFLQGDPAGSESDKRSGRRITTFLEEGEFEDKRGLYGELFDLLRKLSVRVLPPEGDDATGGGLDLPTPDELVNRLQDRKSEYFNRPAADVVASNPVAGDATIFLAYVSEDRAQVEEVYEHLHSLGYNPWMDVRKLVAGEIWDQAITDAINDSLIRLLFFSKTSIAKGGYSRWEFLTALASKKKEFDNQHISLIPVKLDECELPEEFQQIQWVELYQKDGLSRLADAIREGLGRRGA